jgi:hypothetical protein
MKATPWAVIKVAPNNRRRKGRPHVPQRRTVQLPSFPATKRIQPWKRGSLKSSNLEIGFRSDHLESRCHSHSEVDTLTESAPLIEGILITPLPRVLSKVSGGGEYRTRSTTRWIGNGSNCPTHHKECKKFLQFCELTPGSTSLGPGLSIATWLG